MPKCERCPREATVALHYVIKCERRATLLCNACVPAADPRSPFTIGPLPPPPPPDRKP